MIEKFRREFPRLHEILDGQPKPMPKSISFPAFDQTLEEYPQKAKFLRGIEDDLRGLDALSWAALKAKLTPLPKRDAKRGLQPLYDVLNEAKGYNHLVAMGCTNLRFVPLSRIKGQKTPDLEAFDFEGCQVLCDIKTINISEKEVCRRRTGGVGTSSNHLDAGFFRKLKSDLETANIQMVTYQPCGSVRKIVFVVTNFDDNLHEYSEEYASQIENFVIHTPCSNLEIQFDIKPAFSSAKQ